VLDAIAAAGYVTPTEVQARMIPLALAGKNVVARSRTGTGKTCAFLTPALAALDEVRNGTGDLHPRGPVRTLVVVPTRELAIQVAAEAEKLSRYVPVRTACVYGGTPIRSQIRELPTSALVVGTPGRLLDHVERRTLDLSSLETIVLDEVDRMYDLGFRDDVDRILAAARNRRQVLLLSATLNEDVERLIARHVPDPVRVEVQSTAMTVDEVQQTFYVVDPRRKQDLLVALAAEKKPTRCIVFVRTKFSADRLAWRLQQQGLGAKEIHSGLPQARREHILKDFRAGKFPLMIATDVAARGLDIQGVSHVINYDVPENPEDYVHRVGRTARMGEEGWALTFIAPDDGEFITAIEKLINREIKQEQFPGFEVRRAAPVAAAAPKPKERSTGIPQWRGIRRRR
jgi:ATP-dependent RNA helicase DeaD